MKPSEYRVWIDNELLPVEKMEYRDGKLWHISAATKEIWHANVALEVGIAKLEAYSGIDDSEAWRIFEGDIVEVTAADGETYRAPVKWYGEEGYPAFDLDSQYVPAAWNYEANALSTLVAGDDRFMVIGNIHEDSKLLEEE